jgi:hypothetical protein
MKHFTMEEWADFARDVVTKGQRESMQSHLEAGCKECEKVVGLWKRVYEAARKEPLYEPSQTTVRTVKAMYAIHGKPEKNPLTMASLLFDSFAAPMQAGIRSAAVDIRQLLYGQDDYRIDLRLEPRVDSEQISVVGQLLNSVDPNVSMSGIPVTLFRARKPVAETATNRFGEFHFDTELEGNLLLQVAIPQGPKFSVPLIDPIASSEPGDSHSADSKDVKKLLRGRDKSTRKKG